MKNNDAYNDNDNINNNDNNLILCSPKTELVDTFRINSFIPLEIKFSYRVSYNSNPISCQSCYKLLGQGL